MFHCCYFVTLIGVDFEMGDIFQVVVFSTFVGEKTTCCLESRLLLFFHF